MTFLTDRIEIERISECKRNQSKPFHHTPIDVIHREPISDGLDNPKVKVAKQQIVISYGRETMQSETELWAELADHASQEMAAKIKRMKNVFGVRDMKKAKVLNRSGDT